MTLRVRLSHFGMPSGFEGQRGLLVILLTYVGLASTQGQDLSSGEALAVVRALKEVSYEFLPLPCTTQPGAQVYPHSPVSKALVPRPQPEYAINDRVNAQSIYLEPRQLRESVEIYKRD
ncbi:hypothetical protein NDU88_002181 [Pleurodeles waltl]|uniref:Uncharacterized protein n=1 Tax=Pleurodeles waltl TaxID=8319 RepID=A0AAV7SBZ2_PLEWA|nr:hypothetical protein NDU88_002181 [Pleurodeles waltl]